MNDQPITSYMTGSLTVFIVCFVLSLAACYMLDHEYGMEYRHVKNVCFATGSALFGMVLLRFDV